MKNLSDAELRHRAKAFSGRLVVEFSDSVPSHVMSENDDHIRLLYEAGIKEPAPLSILYQRAGLNAESGGKAKDKNIRDGMAVEWSKGWVRKGSGGQLSFLEVTPKGKEVLRRLGFVPFELGGKGSFHAKVFALCYIGAFCRKKRFDFRIEYWSEQKQFDVAYFDEYSRLHAVEIILSGSIEQNVEGIVRAASVGGVYRIHAVCAEKKIVQGISKALRSRLLTVQEAVSVEWMGDYYPYQDEGSTAPGV